MNKKYNIVAALIAGLSLTIYSCSEVDEPVFEETQENKVAENNQETEEPAESEESQDPQYYTLEQGYVDPSLFAPFLSGEAEATFVRAKLLNYNMDELTDGKWELQENIYACTSKKIILSKGKVWETVRPFSFFSPPNAFGLALKAVNSKLKKEYTAMACSELEFDYENNILGLGNKNFGVIEADGDSFTLYHISHYEGGRTHHGGELLELGFYKKTELTELYAKDVICFDSVADAYDWLINLFKKTFGMSVNLNEVFYGVWLDNPIFTLEELIAERNELLS